MDYMYNLYYKDKDYAEILREQRFNFETTLRTRLNISYANNSETAELYYVYNNDSMQFAGIIRRNDRILLELENSLPKIAKKYFRIQLIASEVDYTFRSENIELSRGVISDYTKNVIDEEIDTKNEYEKMIDCYSKIIDFTQIKFPENPKAIRAVYDDILDGLIPKRNQPDGKYFRTHETYLRRKGEESGVITRIGVDGESNIINHINSLLNFISDENMNHVLKAAIFYLYFEYIHPFYAGNSRLARYLVSVFMRESFSHITSLCVARGNVFMLNEHLMALNVSLSKISKGELNYFVETFFEALIRAQESVINYLRYKITKMKSLNEKILNDERLDTRFKKEAMTLLCENYYFDDSASGYDRDDLLSELYGITNVSQSKKQLDDLEEDGFIYKIKGRPIIYGLNSEFAKK